jgi:hypothetical protein
MRLIAIPAAGAAALACAYCLAADTFETPPDEEPAASLPPAQVAGEDFHLDSPVRSDGLMKHYVVDSRFGVFPAYGRGALQVRLREVAALTSIAKTSDTEVALRAVGRGLQEQVKTVATLARNPVRAVTGIPQGIGHLFGGYRAQGEELSEQLHRGTQHSTESGQADQPLREGSVQARRYAERYLGVSAAEMRWYRRLDVDPYTNNDVLRSAVKHLAKVDAAASFGARFVPVTGIPYAGEVGRALNAIYNEDPAALRKRRREQLARYGLSAEEVRRFENTQLLSPTRQSVLVNAVEALNGVAGREELLRHAMTVTSEEEIEVFLRSTAVLLRCHARAPVARILAGVRVPAAQSADGRIALFAGFDALYWTAEVAGYERGVEQLLPAGELRREVWLAGSVSALARQQLEQRGWQVHERQEESAGARPGS